MTTRDISDYLALIPAMNRPQPNFVAFVSTVLDGLVDVQNTMLGMPDDFDLDNALGKQLDACGVRIGLSRKIPIPISGVYFSLDTVGVGLDQGVIRGPHDPVDALTELDDETYRFYLRLKVVANNWDGSLEQAQEILNIMQSVGTLLFVQDNTGMSMSFGIAGILPSVLFVALFKEMTTWLKPAAVRIAGVYATSISGEPIFGLDTENSYISGLDVGTIAVKY